MTQAQREAIQDAEPTEAEVADARDEVYRRGAEADEHQQKLGKRNRDPATMRDLVDFCLMLEAKMMGFTIDHVRKRCVLKDEAITAETTRAITPLWAGIWKAGQAHRANALVAFRDGLWMSKCATVLEPGTGSDWQLCVKRPR